MLQLQDLTVGDVSGMIAGAVFIGMWTPNSYSSRKVMGNYFWMAANLESYPAREA
jgi:hypothetical protein